ncbi:MAG: hypothetical protein WCC87_18515 [Candidatus Korobacteraceae bacterium]
MVIFLVKGKPSDPAPKVEVDDQFLASLKEKIEEVERDIALIGDFEELRKNDYHAEHSLPPELRMDLIHRYEKAAQKKFDWALRLLLESQQRRRKL